MREIFRPLASETFSPRIELYRKGRKSCLAAPTLHCAGSQNIERWQRPTVAIIGTRRPTAYGLRFVRHFVREVAERGLPWNISSGGAFGIDAEVHRACLRYNVATQAWLVGPCDKPHPSTHRALFGAIAASAEGNLFIPSNLEPAPGSSPPGYFWILRNEWIVATAHVLIVVEASLKSGTWKTAKLASRSGIDVHVLPGPVDSQQSEGTNSMILNGWGHPIPSVGSLIKRLVVELGGSSYNEKRRVSGGGGLESASRDETPAISAKQSTLLSKYLDRPGGFAPEEIWELARTSGESVAALLAEFKQRLSQGELRRSGDRFERRGNI